MTGDKCIEDMEIGEIKTVETRGDEVRFIDKTEPFGKHGNLSTKLIPEEEAKRRGAIVDDEDLTEVK